MPFCLNCKKIVSQMGNHLQDAIYQCVSTSGKKNVQETNRKIVSDKGTKYYVSIEAYK